MPTQVVLTFIKWEVAALRRFLRDHEEPPPELLLLLALHPPRTSAALDGGGGSGGGESRVCDGGAHEGKQQARLAELYPLLASGADFTCRRVGPPRRPGPAELAGNPRSKTALLHVIEKVPRRCARGAVRGATPAGTSCPRTSPSPPSLLGAIVAPARFFRPPPMPPTPLQSPMTPPPVC